MAGLTGRWRWGRWGHSPSHWGCLLAYNLELFGGAIHNSVALTGRQLFRSGDEVELSAGPAGGAARGPLGALATALPLLAAGLVLARL